ncbi:MAG: tRNA preQ1(34) S-adenosylmethionine ribosyltransferase-isomerase QueA [Clostridia bacterium]|nr:tRNA preQ1(34) S-adenosylmethionine ribosyltransferase-isomerase QueA [Candidatus Pelethousia sp.]NCB29777.1 tRNA preQ1(34) S-adenosylmethionine ribosyltransferase-isomerase QueA [Clostridia bacterium]
MKTSDFYYDLPQSLIAQTPILNRSASRLLVYNRAEGKIYDGVFTDILKYLRPGDVLVRNTTRVIPARLHGHREGTGGTMEFLLLKRLDERRWECLVKPGRRAKEGLTFRINDELSATVGQATEAGGRIIELHYTGIFEEVLDRAGEVPLPPYITQRLEDKERYQTVYARENGSAAAPTAGLHFTPDLLSALRKQGVAIVDILLHVGLGTFRPVSAENVEEHHMHAEYYEVSPEAAQAINAARSAGGRIFCVGTTSCRTLESVTDEAGIIHSKSGWTDIFITPGYRFKAVDCLITNFHLPESTLLMLVSALCSREEILSAYRHAVEEQYRFFSFGDAMLIV